MRKDIKQADRFCTYCGKRLERKRINGRLEDFGVYLRRKYCNRECMRKAFLASPNKHQSFTNSHTTARLMNELILHKNKCEKCGSISNLDIHHIDGDWNNNNQENLMCLCRSCHMKEHRQKQYCRVCGEPAKAFGLCNKHYIRFKKYGNPYIVYGKDERGGLHEKRNISS